MKVEIVITDITGLVTRTKVVEGALVTTLQLQAKIPVPDIARILNLQRQNVPIFAVIGSPQGALHLNIKEDNEK